MGRKIKSILMLTLLLVLIYHQHSPVLHAENKPGQSGIQAGGNIKETDKDDEDNEGEDKDPDPDPEPKPDPDPEPKPDPDPEPEPEPIKEYRLEMSKADGRNGYYVTSPEAEICHMSKRGRTVYSLKNGAEHTAEGILSEEGDKVRLSGEQFKEGVNILTVCMEDENGVRLKEYERVIEFWVDTIAPVFEVSAPSGFDVWYRDETAVSVSADDGEEGSQIESISCYCGNEIIGTVHGGSACFLVDYASLNSEGVDLTVTVTDKAGHRSENTRKIYIDNSAPATAIEGIRDYMITGNHADVIFRITEDNMLKTFQTEVEWEDCQGRRSYLPEPEWTDKGGIKEARLTCTEDGIYRMKVYAEDAAGHTDEKEAQIIIDSQDPVIRFVDKLEGQYMKKFRWDYEKAEFIQDFTTYQYQIRLDGKLYPVGAEVTEEGRHNLTVEAVDSVGNKSKASAGFVVDHTPPEIIFSDIEEEGTYEEEKTFEITVGNPEDEIREIRINGILQTAGAGSPSGRCTVGEHGYYEVAVSAGDKAGNEAGAGITFEIIPEKTAVQKAIEPIRKLFVREKREEKDEERIEEKKEEGREKKNPAGALPVMLGCSACAGGGLWFVKKRIY